MGANFRVFVRGGGWLSPCDLGAKMFTLAIPPTNEHLGPPAMPFLTNLFGEGSPAKIDHRKENRVPTYFNLSNLEDLANEHDTSPIVLLKGTPKGEVPGVNCWVGYPEGRKEAAGTLPRRPPEP